MKFKQLSIASLLSLVLLVSPTRAETIGLDWNDSPASQCVTNYQVLVSTNNDFGHVVYATTSSSQFSGTFAPGSRYFFRVAAQNLRGTGAQSSSSSTPVAPSTPTGLTNTTTGNVVALSWNANPPSELVYGYDVMVATNVDANHVFFANVTTNEYTTPPLNQGFIYLFRVRANSFGGTSGLSTSSSTPNLPTALAPPSLTITP